MTKDFESESVGNVDEALKLIEKMKKQLPIFVRPIRELVNILRRQDVTIDRYKQLEIHSILYMGNEAGIVCDITPKGQEDKPVFCSLTQLEIIGDDPLTQEMKAYQQERTKNLARYPGNAPIGITITPKPKRR